MASKKSVDKLVFTWNNQREQHSCLLDELMINIGSQLETLAAETKKTVEYFGDKNITRDYLLKVIEIKERVSTINEVFKKLNEGDITTSLL